MSKLLVAGGYACPTSGTNYAAPANVQKWGTVDDISQMLIGVAGTLSNFRVSLTAAPGVGKTRTFTVRVDGVDSGLFVALTGAETDKTDAANSIAVTAFNRVSVKMVAAGLPVACYSSFYMDFTPDVQPLFGAINTYKTCTNLYSSFVSGGAILDVTSGDHKGYITTPGKISDLYAKMNSAPGALLSVSYTVRKNGVDTSLSCTISGVGTTASDTDPSHAITIAAGDYIDLHCVQSATVASGKYGFAAVSWTPDNAGEQVYCFPPTSAPSTSLVSYAPLTNPVPVWGITTNVPQNQGVFPAGSLKLFRVVLESAPGANKSWRLQVIVNGNPSGPDVTISGSDTVGTDYINEAALNAGDIAYIKITPSGSPASTRILWGIVFGLPITAAACWGLHQGAKYEMVS